MIETVPLPRMRTRVLRMDGRLLAVAVFASGAGLAWIRLPAPVRSTVWAEDGALFLSELEKQGFWPTLFKSYTGYLQFWPRVLTELAVQPGLIHFAGAVTLLACCAVGAIGCGVFVWSRSVVASPLVRLALAIAPVLVPMAPLEVLGNLANLHWFVLWGCAWLLLAEPASRVGSIALAMLAATFALTEIQVAVLLPLMLLNRRSIEAWVVRTGLSVGLAIQIASSLLVPRVGVIDHLGLESTVAGYFVNGPLALLVGDQAQAGALLASQGLWVAYAALLPFLACGAYSMIRGTARVRVTILTLFIASAVTWFAAVWMNVSSAFGGMFGYAVFTPDQFRTMSYFRYGFVPGLCLLGIALVTAGVALDGHRAGSRRTGLVRGAGVAILIAFTATTASSFVPARTLRDGEPLWQPSIAAATEVCQAHPGLAVAQVAQAPMSWATDVPCSSLR